MIGESGGGATGAGRCWQLCSKKRFLETDHPAGLLETQGPMHAMTLQIVQVRIGGEFGAPGDGRPIFDANHQRPGDATAAGRGHHVNALQKHDRRGTGSLDIVGPQCRLDEPDGRSLAIELNELRELVRRGDELGHLRQVPCPGTVRPQLLTQRQPTRLINRLAGNWHCPPPRCGAMCHPRATSAPIRSTSSTRESACASVARAPMKQGRSASLPFTWVVLGRLRVSRTSLRCSCRLSRSKSTPSADTYRKQQIESVGSTSSSRFGCERAISATCRAMSLCRLIRARMPSTPISRIIAHTTTPRHGALNSTP